MTTQFAVVAVASKLHDPAMLDRLVAPLHSALEERGGVRHHPGLLESGIPLAVLVVTGGTEGAILDLYHQRQAVVPGEPLVLITMPVHNSLPAALEALAKIQQDGGRGLIVHLSGPDDQDGLARLMRAVEDLDVRRRLHARRIGLVGSPSDWLVASSPSVETVRERWGPTVVAVDMAKLLVGHRDGGADVGADVGAALAGAIKAGAIKAGAVKAGSSSEEILAASGLYGALRGLIDAEQLDVVSVRCFDLIAALRTSGCVALAKLNDEGMVAGCEADLVATVAMLWIRELLGQISWMANPAHVDVRQGLVRLAHCTIAPSLVRDYELTTHFESGLSVGIHGQLIPGPVTLVRIGGREMDRLFIAEGEARSGAAEENMCRTQVDVHVPAAKAEQLLARPYGNHLVLTRGHHAARMTAWWKEIVSSSD